MHKHCEVYQILYCWVIQPASESSKLYASLNNGSANITSLSKKAFNINKNNKSEQERNLSYRILINKSIYTLIEKFGM